MQALLHRDAEGFYEAEIAGRQAAGLPPFGRLASLIVSAPSRPEAENWARTLAQLFPEADNVRLLGPAEPPFAILRGRHRMRLIVKAPRNCDLPAFLRDWLARAPKLPGAVQVQVDVDPMSFV